MILEYGIELVQLFLWLLGKHHEIPIIYYHNHIKIILVKITKAIRPKFKKRRLEGEDPS